jgi:peroxiredoxin
MTSLLIIAAAGFCKNPVPSFSAVASNGIKITEKTLTKKPTVLVFITNSCPMTPKGLEHFNALAKGLGKTGQVVGILNANLSEAKKLASANKLVFPLVPDPKKLIIKGCNAEHSLDFTVIASSDTPKFPKLWSGYSQATVQEGLDIIQKHGKKLSKVNLASFPKNVVWGCAL